MVEEKFSGFLAWQKSQGNVGAGLYEQVSIPASLKIELVSPLRARYDLSIDNIPQGTQ